MAALILAGGCSSGSPEPTCREKRLATATGFEHDPALVIAISRAIAVDHPELTPIVDAAAAYQSDHPDYDTLDPDVDDIPGEVSLTYFSTIYYLATRSDLRNPDLIGGLQRVIDEEGIVGVLDFVEDAFDEYPVEENGGDALIELRRLVDGQETALRDAGIDVLPPALCP